MPNNTIEIVIRATDDASKVVSKIESNVTGSVTVLVKNFDAVGKAAQSADQRIADFGKGLSNIGGKLSIGLTLPLAAAGAAAIKMGMDMEQTRVAFTSMMGSADEAKKHLDELRAFADKTPFEFNELTQASKRMQAFGFEAQKVVPMLTDIGDASAALGMGSEGIDRITRALGQMQAKGKVSGEEMMQLTEAGIPGWRYLAEAMGVTTAEVMKMSERGLIPAQKAIDALLAGMRKDFGGMMAEQSKTAAGQLSTLKDAITSTATSLGEVMLPTVKSAIGVLSSLADALKGMSPEMQQLVVTTGILAASLGPVMKIGGSLIGNFKTLKGGLIDVAGSAMTMGKSVADVAGTLSRIGVNANTVKDALIRLRASGALLAVELGIIVAGLIAIAKYLEEVGNAAKATNEDLIKMSSSGDVFKQAAATTEIFANGQERLKGTLDAVHTKILESKKGYDDYRSSIDATAKAAGYEINAQGDLIRVFYGAEGRIEKVIEAHYRLTKAQYEAVPGAGALGKAWQVLLDTGKKFADIVAPQAGGVIIPLAKSYDVLGEAINRAKTSAMKANPIYADGADALAKLKIAMGGDIKKETDRFSESQKTLQDRLKETADELKNLQREQGSVDKSTTKNAMSAAELAAAQANLAASQARLAKETDPIKQQQLAASIAVQQEKIAGANQAVVTYVDNSKRIGELKGQYDELNTEIAANAAAHEEATRRILFGYAEQQLAINGLTQQEADALNKLAVQWGLKSQADVNAFRAVDEAVTAFAKNADIDAFANKLDRISDKALGIKITPQIDYKNLREGKQEKSLAVTVTPKLDPKKAKTDATELLNSKEMKKLGEPVIIPIKADTNTATVNMRYFNDYGLSPAIVYYDALNKQAALFNTIVGQTPTLPTIPGYTPPTAPAPQPVRPPGAGEPEFAAGGSFVVPPGYSNDSFPMRVSSGERVQVTPAGRSGNMPPININQTFNGVQGDPEQYKRIMYEVISDVFENVNAARK